MSLVILSEENSTLIMCAGITYSLSEGTDGTLHIEEVNQRGVEVDISDDGDCPVTVRGQRINIVAPETSP